jgi:hypothetical protein
MTTQAGGKSIEEIRLPERVFAGFEQAKDFFQKRRSKRKSH